MKPTFRPAFGTMMAALMAGCASTLPLPSTTSTTVVPSTGVVTSPVIEPAAHDPTVLPPGSVRMTELAMADASTLWSVGSSAISVLRVEARDWPDSSLGCPQPGVAYAQVITPGFQITLEANEHVLIYHTDTMDQVVLCQAKPPHEIYGPP